MYYIIIALVLISDQVVKGLVTGSMAVGQSIPLIDKVFYLTYVQNTGAAFSNFEGQRILLISVTSVMIAALIFYLVKKRHDEHWTLLAALALIIAGGLGNLLDRIRLGYVVDMFDFQFWPVFNIADIGVCVGCGFMVLYVFISGRENGKEKTI